MAKTVDTKKEPVKQAEQPVAPAAAEQAEKAPAAKKALAKRATAKKAVEKKAVEKTAVAKRTAEKKPAAEKVETMYVQFAGGEWDLSDIKERAVAAYVALGHRRGNIKSLTVYVKPEESKAYYVVNGAADGSIDL